MGAVIALYFFTKMKSQVMNSSKIDRTTLTNSEKVVRYILYYCETNSVKGLTGFAFF